MCGEEPRYTHYLHDITTIPLSPPKECTGNVSSLYSLFTGISYNYIPTH